MVKKSKQQLEINKKKRLANLRPAKKGEVRNPNGGRAHNPLLKAFKRIQQDNYREALEQVLNSDDSELEAMCDPIEGNSSMRRLIAVSMKEAIHQKNFGLLERITERLFGKVPDQLDLTAKTKATSVDKEAVKEALKELKDEF